MRLSHHRRNKSCRNNNGPRHSQRKRTFVFQKQVSVFIPISNSHRTLSHQMELWVFMLSPGPTPQSPRGGLMQLQPQCGLALIRLSSTVNTFTALNPVSALHFEGRIPRQESPLVVILTLPVFNCKISIGKLKNTAFRSLSQLP